MFVHHAWLKKEKVHLKFLWESAVSKEKNICNVPKLRWNPETVCLSAQEEHESLIPPVRRGTR